MPIYEYRCTTCNHELEVLQKITDTPLQICPKCSQETLQKLISAANFRLKGSGWYETDFKDKGQKNIHGDDKDKKAQESESSSESKPESKSEAKTTSETTSTAKTDTTTKNTSTKAAATASTPKTASNTVKE